MQHWRFSSVWSCMCVSWSLSYSTLFQWLTAPHLQSSYCTHASALCSWVPLVGTLEHEALVWVGYKLWRWAIICHVECITVSFLTFFQFGENTQWIMDGSALGRMGAKVPNHHEFSARVDSTEIVRAGAFNCNKATKWISGATLLFIHSSNTECIQ
jgi:hypothetical protein